MKRWVFLLFIILLSLSLISCPPKPAPPPPPEVVPAPITVKDDVGKEITLLAFPERIISIGPSITEILYAIGMGDKIVGTDNFSDFPPEAKAKPKVGAPFPGISVEKVIELKPDLIIAIPGVYLDPVRALKTPIVELSPKDLNHVLDNILLIGKITGAEDKAREVVSAMIERIHKVLEKTAKVEKRPRVFFVFDATDPTKPWTAGPGTFINDLIHYAGGDNIGSRGVTKWFQMSSEMIILLDPEVIILGKFAGPPEMVPKYPWGKVEAVKRGAIYTIDDDLVVRPGPRLVLGLEMIAKILHPHLFASIPEFELVASR